MQFGSNFKHSFLAVAAHSPMVSKPTHWSVPPKLSPRKCKCHYQMLDKLTICDSIIQHHIQPPYRSQKSKQQTSAYCKYIVIEVIYI